MMGKPLTLLLGFVLSFITPQALHASVIQLPKTGQATCYDEAGGLVPCPGTGQDGELRNGVAAPEPRFHDNGNGTVTDNLTGLIWLKDATCRAEMLWDEALKAANTLETGQCGLADDSVPGDWRLPNVLELESLIDLSNIDPALPAGHPFTDVKGGFWTSTTNAYHPVRARYIDIRQGTVNGSEKNVGTFYAWPVRGGSQ